MKNCNYCNDWENKNQQKNQFKSIFLVQNLRNCMYVPQFRISFEKKLLLQMFRRQTLSQIGQGQASNAGKSQVQI